MIDCKPLIVVVHENPAVLEALQCLLSEQDYLVSTFTSALRSIEFVHRAKPDLILAEQPGDPSKGIEFLEAIKRISPTTEGLFLPSPLRVDPADGRLRREQADELIRIVDRLLGIMVIPEQRRATRIRPLVV